MSLVLTGAWIPYYFLTRLGVFWHLFSGSLCFGRSNSYTQRQSWWILSCLYCRQLSAAGIHSRTILYVHEKKHSIEFLQVPAAYSHSLPLGRPTLLHKRKTSLVIFLLSSSHIRPNSVPWSSALMSATVPNNVGKGGVDSRQGSRTSVTNCAIL